MTFALLHAAHGQQLTWRGTPTDNVWSTWNGSTAWAPGNGTGNGSGKSFEDFAAVTFNGTGSVTNVAVSGTVAPSSLTISSGVSYSFTPLTGGSIQASGAINISGSLTLNATSSINTPSLPLLSAPNSGITVNNGGSLILAGTGNHLGDSTNIQLSGGTLAITGNGASETFGALTLTSSSTLDFSGTGSSLTFSSISGNGVLNIFNFDPTDRLYLTQPTTATINFYSGSDISSPRISYTAEVVPEPSTIFAGIGLAGFLAWRERRRISSLLKRNQPEEALTTS